MFVAALGLDEQPRLEYFLKPNKHEAKFPRNQLAPGLQLKGLLRQHLRDVPDPDPLLQNPLNALPKAPPRVDPGSPGRIIPIGPNPKDHPAAAAGRARRPAAPAQPPDVLQVCG